MSSSDNGGRDTAPEVVPHGEFDGKRVLVTGGSRGIGAAISQYLAIAVHEWRRWPALGARRTHRFRT